MQTKVAVHQVVQCAANITLIPVEMFYSHSRLRHISLARFAIFAVSNELGHGMKEIGRRMNNRDHTSVMHGIRRAAEFEQTKPSFRMLIEALRQAVAQISNTPRPRLVPVSKPLIEKFLKKPAPVSDKTKEELKVERRMIAGSNKLARAVQIAGGYR